MRIFVIDGMGMKEQRMKAARNINVQCKKSRSILSSAVFEKGAVNITDIEDHGRYYGGPRFMPIVAFKYMQTSCQAAGKDAARCDGLAPQSYVAALKV